MPAEVKQKQKQVTKLANQMTKIEKKIEKGTKVQQKLIKKDLGQSQIHLVQKKSAPKKQVAQPIKMKKPEPKVVSQKSLTQKKSVQPEQKSSEAQSEEDEQAIIDQAAAEAAGLDTNQAATFSQQHKKELEEQQRT